MTSVIAAAASRGVSDEPANPACRHRARHVEREDEALARRLDVQSAPHGASEFIDARLASLSRRGARYLAISLISFRGQPFAGFPCFAGFMERDGLDSGEVYEPGALALTFAVAGRTPAAMPLLFDVREREVIYVDLALGGGLRQRVGAQRALFQALVRTAVDLPNTKPTAWDVWRTHALARGTLVDDPAAADRVVTRDGLDLAATMALRA